MRETDDASVHIPIFEAPARYPKVSPNALPLGRELRLSSAWLILNLTQPLQHMVAFVAGIGDYETLQKLKNPCRDAKAIADALRERNAQVFDAYDCGIKQLEAQFRLFEASIRPGDTAFVYLACHGEMFKNRLRLIAISDSKPDLEKDALDLQILLARWTIQHPQ